MRDAEPLSRFPSPSHRSYGKGQKARIKNICGMGDVL